MENSLYFGTYAQFETASKKDAAPLLGADNLVGDIFEIEFVTQEGLKTAWMKNRFGALVAYFDYATSRELAIYEARGWKLRSILSFVAFSESAEDGKYWGETALVCYAPGHEAFDEFVVNVSQRIGEGIRPDLDLGQEGIEHVIKSDGAWSPSKTIPLPTMQKGHAILKSRRKITEKLIEQGRKGNKGCYFLSWAFLLALIAALIFGLRSCGVF